jgi:hypothetical protein
MIKRALVVLGIFILGIGLLANQLQLAAVIVIPILLGILVYGLMSSCGGVEPRFSYEKEKEKGDLK